ncbi:MAG: response regulator [Rhodocyclaceae bacterium]|nr:response regulator [Rhodocyclaceae bacterium]
MTRTILIVDDEPNILISLEFLMKREGFQVYTAGDGEEALERIAQHRPEMVLLDVMMPKKNGYEVCQIIRGTPEWQDTKVIMISAKGRDTEMAKGLAMGANAYMTKPFSTKDLVAKVKEMLEAA